MPTSKPTIRHSVIAGSWYPGSAAALSRTIGAYLGQAAAEPMVPGQLVGLISPHAGYAYSGQTAAHAYRQLEGRSVELVVLLGPSHRVWLNNYAANAEDAFETPLGRVPVDHEFVSSLAAQLPLGRIQQDPEHSLEIQLPFLQRQLGDFRLAPIMISADEPALAERLGLALAKTIHECVAPDRRDSVLLVASSDLHHMEDYDEVVRRDRQVIEAIAGYDLPAITSVLMAPGCTVCGRMPILAVLHAARALGADQVRILHHTTSGDVTGERQRGQYTVGYMAAGVYRTAASAP